MYVYMYNVRGFRVGSEAGWPRSASPRASLAVNASRRGTPIQNKHIYSIILYFAGHNLT